MADMREALKPCPFCELHHSLKLTTAEELANEGEDDPEPWTHSDSFAVICDASRPNGPGGCGASGGFKPTAIEAIETWNRRAPSPTAEQPERPPYCGSGHCSCIECPYAAPPEPSEVKP